MIYDEQKKSGQIILSINGAKAGETTFGRSIASIYSHEGVNVGLDDLTAVSNTYNVPFAFTGKINNVTIDFDTPQQSYLQK